MPPAARVGDSTTHGTPLSPGPGSTNVLIGGMPAWRAMIDQHACPAVSISGADGVGSVMMGSPTVLINNQMACRQMDIVIEKPGLAMGPANPILMGCLTVIIGEAGPMGVPIGLPNNDCAKAWKEIEDQANAILDKSTDPIQRNKNINAAYAKLYLQDRRLHWLGAAAFASKQVGCGLQEAKRVADQGDAELDSTASNGVPPDPITLVKADYAKTVYDTLATGNRRVFKDVYPAHLFYEKYGIEKLRDCAGARQPPLDNKVLDGLADTDAGRSAEGAIKILQHEQQDILQSKDVFGNEEIAMIMGRNQWWSNYAIGRFFGAQKTSVSYSPDCGGEPVVTFDGANPADPNERWPYAQKVVGKFEDLISNPSTDDKVEKDLSTIVGRGE
jgi:uncharacterized Zn-binding protein involved in type VI secretion